MHSWKKSHQNECLVTQLTEKSHWMHSQALTVCCVSRLAHCGDNSRTTITVHYAVVDVVVADCCCGYYSPSVDFTSELSGAMTHDATRRKATRLHQRSIPTTRAYQLECTSRWFGQRDADAEWLPRTAPELFVHVRGNTSETGRRAERYRV